MLYELDFHLYSQLLNNPQHSTPTKTGRWEYSPFLAPLRTAQKNVKTRTYVLSYAIRLLI